MLLSSYHTPFVELSYMYMNLSHKTKLKSYIFLWKFSFLNFQNLHSKGIFFNWCRFRSLHGDCETHFRLNLAIRLGLLFTSSFPPESHWIFTEPVIRNLFCHMAFVAKFMILRKLVIHNKFFLEFCVPFIHSNRITNPWTIRLLWFHDCILHREKINWLVIETIFL